MVDMCRGSYNRAVGVRYDAPPTGEPAMKIDVRFISLDSSRSFREHARRRLHLRLGRFASEISDIVVRVTDVNGPKGGLDKRCQVTIRGPKLGDLSVEELREDVHAAAHSAVERAGRAVGRALERARATSRAGETARVAS